MSSINQGTIDSAVKEIGRGNVEPLRAVLNAMLAQHLAVANATGVQLLEPTSGGKPQTPVVAPPSKATLAVTGANGAHNITITNPASTIPATIYHQLRYSASPNFGNSTLLPPSPSTTLSVPMPGSTLNWGIRSSYDQVHWNDWTPSQGNPTVAAGLQSSAATSNATALNQTNYAVVDAVPAAGAANVRVHGQAGPGTMWIGVKGPTETLLPSATIINQTLGTTPFVGYDGEQFMVKSTLPQVFGDNVTPAGQVGVPPGGAVTLPAITPVLSAGGIVGYNVTSGGSNISAPLTLTIAGTGSGATTGTQTITGGHLVSVAPGNPGSGYTAATVTPSGGASTGTAGGGGITGSNEGRYIPV